MITLEQVKLLDARISNAVEYIKKITNENASLKGKLDSYQKRIEELEVLVQRFREDQNRIEDGILSALDRLNQFEDALESKLSAIPAETPKPAAPVADNSGSAKPNPPEAEDEADDEPEPPDEIEPSLPEELPDESVPVQPADTAKPANRPAPVKPADELDIF